MTVAPTAALPQNGSPMSKQTNIIVQRYAPSAAGYAATVQPEGGGWTLFVPADGGPPDLWIEVDATDENGATVRGLVSVHDYADPRREGALAAARLDGARAARKRCIEAAQSVDDGDAVTAMRIADRIEGLAVGELTA